MEGERRRGREGDAKLRKGDLEPYTALRWVGTIFKAAAIFLIVAVFAEMVAGIRIDGWSALPFLLGEMARTAVLAVVLWGAGDLVRLLIHVGHDIRADRILLTRLAHRQAVSATPDSREPHGDTGPRRRERGGELRVKRGREAAAD